MSLNVQRHFDSASSFGFYGSIEFRKINNTPFDLKMMSEAYRDVFDEAFPDKEGREELDQMINYIKEAEASIDKVNCVVAGENLDDPKNRKLVGIAYSCIFMEQGVGTFSYTAISPSHRSMGLARKMITSGMESLRQEAHKNNVVYHGTFIEIHDPTKVKVEEDSIDPYKRQKIFERWGARRVPLDYINPAPDLDKKRSNKFLVYACPDQDGNYPNVQGVLNYVRAQYRVFGVKNLEADPDFLKMKQQLEVWDGQFIPPTYEQELSNHVEGPKKEIA